MHHVHNVMLHLRMSHRMPLEIAAVLCLKSWTLTLFLESLYVFILSLSVLAQTIEMIEIWCIQQTSDIL